MWYTLGTVETSTTGEATCDVQVPQGSAWFSGHFPGDPVLPGIAQLGIVYDVLCRSLGDQPCIAGFSRVKFRKILRPQDCLKITIVPKNEAGGLYAFRIAASGEIACSGNLTLRKPDDILEKGVCEHDEG